MVRVSLCGQCRWQQSSLRVSLAGAGGRMGRVRVRGGDQAGSIKTVPAPPGDGGGGRHKPGVNAHQQDSGLRSHWQVTDALEGPYPGRQAQRYRL
jgi:hypothetical protein